MIDSLHLRRAIHLALATSAAVPLSQRALAQEQTEADQPAELGTQVVTGTRIRRVDLETASPVYTLDRDTIEGTGVTTLGDLVQQVPTVAGAATNPQVNNGGGTGAANISLRGLGSERTLVLLNGRRIGALGQLTSAVDVNLIPINLVERVEILKEGAGAIYGSDAIGGVVNFITRRDFEGAEVDVDWGISGQSDGERRAVNLTWGTSSDRGNIILGANYNEQEEVSAADRDFSKFALYLYGSYGIFEGGSSRTPTGNISFTGTGCEDVTRIEGRPGTSLEDYRCFTANDLYNYQPLNLIMTPQERGSAFAFVNFDVGQQVEMFAEVIHNFTTSGFQIAPLPFDARADNVIISADSIYNPFGIDFGGATPIDPQDPNSPLRPNALFRLEALGNRESDVDTTTDQVNIGLRGNLFQTSWAWEATAGYGRMDQDTSVAGYLFQPRVQQALGPSFIAPDGTPMCGTPEEPIDGCIPVNIFNLEDPSQIEALQSIAAEATSTYRYSTRMAQANLTGDLFQLPAGALSAAAGYEYRKQSGKFDTDFLTEAQPPTFQNCLLASETCSGDSSGEFDVNEVYAELFVPVLADKPFADALNLSAGVRYSDYSTFGDTTNSVFKLEYRPVSDLLIRGSFAEIFRAPTINDLFGAPTADAAQLNDPCVGLTEARLAANPNLALACQNVPTDGSFDQPNSQISGLVIGNPDLDAETGEVLTYGFVYEPGWANGLSFTLDFWDYEIDNVITALDVQFSMDQCAATGDPQFCGLITRFPDGEIQVFQEPTVNLGRLETNGFDFGTRYRLRGTPVGDFLITLDASYIDRYDTFTAEGQPPEESAGKFNRQFGNFARWRGTLGVGWAGYGFDALMTTRYIHELILEDPDGAPPERNVVDVLEIDPQVYVDLSLGYTFRENTKFRVGGENLFDEQPPIMFQNNVLNANTDVNTYDTIGRFFWARVSHKF